jgi:riboflavin synthase
MFTGIIEHMGVLQRREPTAAGARLEIRPPALEEYPRPGDSVAVDGVCLTLASPIGASGGVMVFDVVPQTLALTTLGELPAGTRVHLELAMRAGDRLGGHFVQGHADGVGIVRSVSRGGEWRARIEAPEGVRRALTPRGSVCVDGVSLTLADVGESGAWFEVVLIPTTLEKTKLSGLREGSRVNIEADIIAKQVAFWLEQRR